MINFFYIRFEYIKQHGLKKYLRGILNRVLKAMISIPDKLFYRLLGQKYLHWRSQRYWSNAQDTYRASSDYYERQDVALRSLLSSIAGPKDRAMDVGCGDGRFTLIIAKSYANVWGFDISPQLIEKANTQAKSQGILNLTFEQMDLTASYPEGIYDLVACMGVTAAIVADDDFSNLAQNLVNSLNPDGYLITKDSLSSSNQWEKFNGHYVAMYRNALDYENKFSALGLRLLQKTLLATSEHSPLVNYIYLWQKL